MFALVTSVAGLTTSVRVLEVTVDGVFSKQPEKPIESHLINDKSYCVPPPNDQESPPIKNPPSDVNANVCASSILTEPIMRDQFKFPVAFVFSKYTSDVLPVPKKLYDAPAIV